ncbi:amidinotransferase [Pseudomonas aeruginosa]|uniref:citrulline utilization hydrolase CtlX n=1 Tax=Pseudomonas aeruginosa TaxID=287 RepID=UPI000F8343E7|nr:arginine deiminase-related protein [Pseudomonas aeruginosa]RTR61072.1 amidinotransferase [Pseudomonas aeruginosa]
MQTTSSVLMVRPANFAFNPDTAGNNPFQHDDLPAEQVQRQALEEFDRYVEALRAQGIEVRVVQDSAEPHTPDSIFPNNGFSTHADGTLVLYPMQGRNRRLERGKPILPALEGFRIGTRIDLTGHEQQDIFLEGTGSLVLDREARIAYACRSIRTHDSLLDEFASRLDYRVAAFDAVDRQGIPIYHTNVMMSVGSRLALVCLVSLPDSAQRERLRRTLEASGKQVLELNWDQLERFAGNMLELRDANGQPLLVMSRSAWESLDDAQRSLIESRTRPLVVDIGTIERVGGGSARCMLAEIHLPRLEVRP